MEPEATLPCSTGPATSPYPGPDDAIRKVSLNNSRIALSLRFPYKYVRNNSHFLHSCYVEPSLSDRRISIRWRINSWSWLLLICNPQVIVILSLLGPDVFLEYVEEVHFKFSYKIIQTFHFRIPAYCNFQKKLSWFIHVLYVPCGSCLKWTHNGEEIYTHQSAYFIS